MNIHRTARLTLALLALLSFNAYCATPPSAATSVFAPAAATVPSDPQAGTNQDQSSNHNGPPPPAATASVATIPATTVLPAASQSGNDPSAAVQSHKAPRRPASATPKEQAAVVAQVASPNDPSGFRLMTLSTNALLSRVSLADHAEHSIDMQYYIFRNDATGRLIALHVLQAADRGVHVRILVDAYNLGDDVHMFEALDSHPNIAVRLFNPFHTRNPNAVSKFAQLLLEFRRLNRRMHNKSFIVDNDVAIIGGRNIGDAYFDANVDNNFRDLDVLAIGPVVPAATSAFEAYWNSDAAEPLTKPGSRIDPAKTPADSSEGVVDSTKDQADLAKKVPTDPTKGPTNSPKSPDDAAKGLAELRVVLEKNARKFEDSAYKQAALNDLPHGPSADRPGNWYWGHATLVADQPEKIETGSNRTDLRIGPELKALINDAQSEVLMISPYFVPGKQDDKNFIALAQRGVAVKVLTNSLASTDEVPAHEGYSDHRRGLLQGGVQLYELKTTLGVKMATTVAGASSDVSLHAKSFVVDRRYVFIGSMNMDQRSKLLNTEMGVVVDSPQLAKAVAEFFGTATLPANAYHVVLGAPDGSHASEMHWQATKDGKVVDYDSEPDAPMHRRAEVLLMKVLPISGLL
jgi:putative cardiolipin synthase